MYIYFIGTMKYINIKCIDKKLTNYDVNKMNGNIKKSISDRDIEKYFGGAKNNIILYNDLQNYNSVDDLLPNNLSCKIILVREEESSGHWFCISRYNNFIEVLIHMVFSHLLI